ncbi:ZIP family metal transporter [Chryseobacterium sp. NEB161]|nr:ZIP family metal transporter [Chryseobacterium sp. NEB161]
MIILLLILSVLIGVFLGKYFGSKQQLAKSLLILSAGFLITICLNEVFPQVYHSDNHNIGVYVILGVLVQMLLENLTKGFEHGHLHHHSDDHAIIPVALIAGLFVHAFIEGIPLSHEKQVLSPYLLGILFHNVPISFVLGSFLAHSKNFSPKFWLIVMIFALASPLGMLLGKYFDEDLKVYFLAIVGGIFLHISSVIIFESNKNHKMDWQKIILVICGVSLALMGHFFHLH